MKKIILLISSIIASATFGLAARDLVILHTNDTHSLIDPDRDGSGGVLQRKAIIDSVRKAERNVILVDAGDKVQGTLYFKFFKGDVEYPLQNMLGVDISILGNHEFDNGMDMLAKNEATQKAELLSANYDFSGTPAEGLFKPYTIRKIGGKKIGFVGINVDPESLIAEKTRTGLKYSDAIEAANKWAAFLRQKKGCDLVVAVTHIGYNMGEGMADDVKLARQSKDIDVIIGGHSHTLIDPNHPEKNPYLVNNAEGRPVLIAQCGKSGKFIGEIRIDLDNLKSMIPSDYDYTLIPVTDRFPAETLDKKIKTFLAPYAAALDSVSNEVIGYAACDMLNNKGEGEFHNWTADFAAWYGELKLDSLRISDPTVPHLDFAIMNSGGIRNSIMKGNVTRGQILSAFPFNNKFVVMEISGKDLIETFKIAAKQGGQPVSNAVRIVTDGNRNLLHAIVDMKEIDPEKTYVVGTIDYLAWGNDYLTPLANGKWIYADDTEVCVPLIRYMKLLTDMGLPMEASPVSRYIIAQ